MSRRWRACMVLALLLPCAAVAAAAPAADRDDALADALFARSRAPGLVMAVVHGDQVRFLARGRQAPERAAAPDADSLLRVNSLSKVMAADLFAQRIADGSLAPRTPLARFAEGAPVPGGEAITLLQLATHTAGIPRDMPDAQWPADAAPNTWPDRAVRWHWLVSLPAQPPPGQVARYSTPGFLFLGDALAVQAGMPYPQLLRERFSAPLGMVDTTAAPSATQCARLMRAASDNPLRYACRDTRNTAASAGMYSTARDIARWMQAMLRQQRDGGYLPWRQQIARNTLHEVIGLDVAGHADGIGLGWLRLDGDAQRPLIVEKTGAGGGFTAYLALAPERDTGVFVAYTDYDPQVIAAVAAQVNGWLAASVRECVAGGVRCQSLRVSRV